jgi:hypothetical protein
VRELFEQTGTPLPELVPVEPVTRYRFADGSTVELSASLEASRAALDAWSPGDRGRVGPRSWRPASGCGRRRSRS